MPRPAAPDPDAERFVAQGRARPAVRPRRGGSREVLERSDGRQLRKLTSYLPVDLAKRLARACVELETDQSALLTAALRAHLDALGQ